MSYQAYLDSIKAKSGMTPAEFRTLAQDKGLLAPGVKAGKVVRWLKEDYGLGHGHAMAMYGAIKPADGPRQSTDEAVAAHFAGRVAVKNPGDVDPELIRWLRSAYEGAAA